VAAELFVWRRQTLRGSGRKYLVKILKPCTTYPDEIRCAMIRRFKGKFAEAILQGRTVPKGFPANLAKAARRKLIMVDAAAFLEAFEFASRQPP
jgi:hypothetical protein